MSERLIVNTTDLGQGFTVEQLENERGDTYYRVCHKGICRYCEDSYMAYMYAEGMGWNKPTD